jgi:hypothetical protein
MEEMTKVSTSGAQAYEAVNKVYKLATRGKGGKDAGEYYPIMYFVDQEYVEVPTTCGGKWDSKTVYGVSIPECAAACDDSKDEPACSGFFYHKSMCFLFSKFESVTYYTGCVGEGSGEFLQAYRRNQKLSKVEVFEGMTTSCFAKLENFEGTNLTPDPKGERKDALNHLKQASRCPEGEATVAKSAAAEPRSDLKTKNKKPMRHWIERGTPAQRLRRLHAKPNFTGAPESAVGEPRPPRGAHRVDIDKIMRSLHDMPHFR